MTDGSPRIYTKTGDDGTTGRLFGGRLGKDDPLVAACGDIDEAVAALGVARALLAEPAPQLADAVLALQRQFFVVAADLMANPRARDKTVAGRSRVTAAMVDALEQDMDRRLAARPLAPVFIVPGANPASAQLDLARAIVRRAERSAVAAVAAGHAVSAEVTTFLNRVGDLVFVLARQAAGDVDEAPSHD